MTRVARLAASGVLLALALVGVAWSDTQQIGNMQVHVSAQLAPKALPRDSLSPIAVSVGWKITSTDGAETPTLKTVKIEINRNGVLDPTGLPTCPYSKIQPASTSRALQNCRAALVGTGDFSALVGLEGQESYVTHGKMVVFNSVEGGTPVLYGQIYAHYPFAASFVIPFKVSRSKTGTYGTTLTAKLPRSLLDWGNLTEVNMSLSRKFAFHGRKRSFLSAACPTPKGFGTAVFPLARTSFTFSGGRRVSSTLTENCKVRH